MVTLADLFSADGPLSDCSSSFSPRAEQLAMSELVQSAIDNVDTVLIEAGTGVGKTFAYLVPALLSGKKTVVSTGTKALQEQCYERDLSTVRAAFKLPVKTALLKGRGNYLCPYRLQISLQSFQGNAQDYQRLLAIKAWGEETLTGDISATALLNERSPLWSNVTSTADNCLGQECPDWEQCFLVKARRKAQKADIVVINHHLLFADFVVREDGFGEVLPEADVFILDEAHQLPDVGSQFLGKVLSTHQFKAFSKDVIREMDNISQDMPDLLREVDELIRAAEGMEQSVDDHPATGFFSNIKKKQEFEKALHNTNEVLERITNVLFSVGERSKGMERCHQRAEELSSKMALFTQPDVDNEVKWYERRLRSLLLRTTPLNIGEYFQSFLAAKEAAWIMTSATLTVARSFDFFNGRLGIKTENAYQLGSPFDYRKQAILYTPTGLPDPRHVSYTKKMMEKALEVIELSRGRAFVLFTSFKALHEAAAFLESRMGYPLLVQGREGKTVLLEKFRKLGNAVLLGTMSFWEGVDVKGSALSCVIIDKLPFSPPNDPVMSARIDALKQQGDNPFMNFQLPNAAITLKQGLGRLIRDANDRGVLMLCDPRLTTARYGKVFMDSLPKMRVTTQLDELQPYLIG